MFFFLLLKPSLNVFTGERSSLPNGFRLWYRSPTRDNQTNLNWEFQNEELLINLDEVTTFIAFADDDGGNIVQDLMNGPPFERLIPISDYISTQPNSITVEELDIELEYELTIDW